MSAVSKDKMKMSKGRKSTVSNTNAKEKQSIVLPQKVFLYLHPKSITYPLGNAFSDRSEIELTHQYCTITILSDHYMPRNIIEVNKFDVVKPTFSITIEQDSLEVITTFSDSPILLTLYDYTKRILETSVTSKSSVTDDEIFEDIRVPVAQGHIDIIEVFNNKRIRSTDTVFLYPLKNNDKALTCKTEWEIYSLHPLLKNIVLSNFLFITLDSLYNINEDLLNNCQNLAASLSFISKMTNENNEYDKIFICDFKTFSKSIISDQILTKSWESLKSDEFENISSMGIASASKFNLNQLFSNLLSTDNVELKCSNINITEDFALTCNSMHRYVLTDNMQKILEYILSKNLYHIIVEIYSQQDVSKILLQGYIDLSVFLYPEVNNCSFAIELRQPDYIANSKSLTRNSSKSGKAKGRSKALISSQEQVIDEIKIPFAIIKICLWSPITNPIQDLAEVSNQKPKPNKFCQYTLTSTKNVSLHSSCDQSYRVFDTLILEILDYIVNNNIKTLNDDKEFFCHQLSNLHNKIMKLVACDFNIKTPTKTSIEFTNLITTVYRDLISRTYDYLNKCSVNGLENCVFTITKTQSFIVDNMSLAKYLYEVGNLETANILMNKLCKEYPNNSMLKFYIFLYDIEKQNFEEVEKYLKSSSDDKDIEGELFADLIQTYIIYKRQLQDSEENATAEENLIKALRACNMNYSSISLTVFILLYCIYKRHNYKPGMEYCRWKYENLYDSIYIQIEFIPKSRWEIYMPHNINLKSAKGQNFLKVCQTLLRLGLYLFAQWVFDEIAKECLEIEKYFFSSTFMIFENKVDHRLSIKSFPVDKLESPREGRATLSLVNGNLEHFYVNGGPASIKHYQDILELKELQTYGPYQLGLLRYAYKMLEGQQYEEARRVFLNLCNNEDNCLVAAFGRAKACYYLGQLDEAEKYFALSTEYEVYMPNTWAYLALINLKKGNNYAALECWKYARLNPNIQIHEEIRNELGKINYSDVFLFVDVPNKI